MMILAWLEWLSCIALILAAFISRLSALLWMSVTGEFNVVCVIQVLKAPIDSHLSH